METITDTSFVLNISEAVDNVQCPAISVTQNLSDVLVLFYLTYFMVQDIL